jgi:dolichyldiphosphatase
MAAYAALAVQTRELTIITMWAGQLFCEGFNWVLKRAIKQDRPIDSLGNGYGFPSSHSQYMGFFASFLICHLYFRHRFASCGYPILDRAWRVLLYLGVGAWAVGVAYSRYHLKYHTPHQIIWGFAIGAFLGLSLYITTELIPRSYPTSLLGRARDGLLSGTVATWLQIRDGWDIWNDGGREEEWVRWKGEWERRRQRDNPRDGKKE